MLLFIWFLVWLFNHHPWLLSSWNVWNISAIVCSVLDGGFGGSRLRRG
jgi:hypothetical protein